MDVERIPFSPFDLLADVEQLLYIRTRDTDVELRIEVATEIPVTIQSALTRLREILINLTANAIKFTNQGSVLIVASMEAPDALKCPMIESGVIDQGIGMMEEQSKTPSCKALRAQRANSEAQDSS